MSKCIFNIIMLSLFIAPVSGGGAIDQTAGLESSLSIPLENKEKGRRPDDADAKKRSELLLKAIIEEDFSLADEAFFPGDAFNLVKGIKDPAAYYKTLLKWYHDDIAKEHAKLKSLVGPQFDRFQLGFCKWREKGSEANALPYWSCYRNKLFVKHSGGVATIEIKAMINWGSHWHITHLGPIPQK